MADVGKKLFMPLRRERWCSIFVQCHFYRPQRSCGQGNIFTPVCHSVHGGGGSASVHAGIPPLPMGPDPPPDQTPLPGKQTPAYGLRATGTHPTGMHSCKKQVWFCVLHVFDFKKYLWAFVEQTNNINKGMFTLEVCVCVSVWRKEWIKWRPPWFPWYLLFFYYWSMQSA